MKPYHLLESTQMLKVLGDEKRQKILRILMAQPATLTQLGAILNLHPANIRHHLKKLETAGLVELKMQKIVRGFVEKYYQASAIAYHINLTILPHTDKGNTIVAAGSHDFALEALSTRIFEGKNAPAFFSLPIGSLNGLIALRQGLCQVAGCHLFDPASGEYNLPHLNLLFPDRQVKAICLANRQQGLIVGPKNPKNIQGLDDLLREDIHFINRNPGSGTRIWTEKQLDKLNLAIENIQGYEDEVNTHTELAQVIRHGKADVGVGLEAAATKYGLGFIPLFKERFDLILLEELFTEGKLLPMLDILNDSTFHHAVEGLPGYSAKQTGQEMLVQ